MDAPAKCAATKTPAERRSLIYSNRLHKYCNICISPIRRDIITKSPCAPSALFALYRRNVIIYGGGRAMWRGRYISISRFRPRMAWSSSPPDNGHVKPYADRNRIICILCTSANANGSSRGIAFDMHRVMFTAPWDLPTT